MRYGSIGGNRSRRLIIAGQSKRPRADYIVALTSPSLSPEASTPLLAVFTVFCSETSASQVFFSAETLGFGRHSGQKNSDERTLIPLILAVM